MLFKIESYHNGGAYALDLLCFRINHPLCEMKTFGADFSNGCLYSDMIRTINLCKEVRFYMYDDNAVFLPILCPSVTGIITEPTVRQLK